jgi:hypothetical protein
MTSSKTTPSFKDAIELTTQTIDRRAGLFQNLIVLVVGLVVGSLLWAAVVLSWHPLLALLALVPLCGFFLCLDTWLVNRWRQHVLELWAQGQVSLDGLVKGIRSIRLLPPRTLQAMLASVPTKDNNPRAFPSTPVLRRALVATLETINRCDNARTGVASIAYALGVASLVLAAIQGTWMPLAGVLLVGPLLAAAWWLKAAHWRRWKWTLLSLHCQQGLDWTGFVPAANQLDWGSISDRKKQRLLLALQIRRRRAS